MIHKRVPGYPISIMMHKRVTGLLYPWVIIVQVFEP